MTLALFGGTFDPVHNGHLLMAESARDAFGFSRVIFIPSGHPPHKKNPSTSARHRLAMLRLAVHGNSGFSVDDWEIRENRIVYTFETLAYFQSRHPREKIAFIIGSDSLLDLHSWRHGETLLRQYEFVVVERPSAPWAKVPVALRRRVRLVPSPAVPFASRDIRLSVKSGHSVRYQVPQSVEDYIRRHRLYGKKAA